MTVLGNRMLDGVMGEMDVGHHNPVGKCSGVSTLQRDRHFLRKKGECWYTDGSKGSFFRRASC
eukprot:7044254-Prorocentrum_lima.AAC.1